MASELINIPGSSIYYYVDVENGTVIAKMDNVVKEVYLNINKLKRSVSKSGVRFINLYMEGVSIPKSLSGKATCGESDEFNLDFGMRLARERLLHKFYNILTGIWVGMNNEMEDFLEELEGSMLKSLHNTIRFKNPGGFWGKEEEEENEEVVINVPYDYSEEDSEDGAPTTDSSSSEEEDEENDDGAAQVESQVED